MDLLTATANKKTIRRPLDGVLLFDKPFGISSNQALQKVKRLYQAEKAGHTGSLDPIATGILPIVFGEATKFSQHLLDADKQYLVTGKLGIRTASADCEGDVIAVQSVDVSLSQLHNVVNRFVGKIQQIPPMFSALKSQGKPLYQLARQGITIERMPREISIYSISLIDFNADLFTLSVHCSKGTYIRTLIDDIGLMLGCGAHVVMLRRKAVAGFSEQNSLTLEQLSEMKNQVERDNFLLPTDTLIQNLPKIDLDESAAFYFRRGQAIVMNNRQESRLFRVYCQEMFLGVAECDDKNKLQPKRLITQPKTEG